MKKDDTVVTIKEDFILPSLGQIYAKPFDPHVELRSMTVAEEMKRLSPSNTPYKTMSEIIDDCLLTKLPISAYDMCLGDYIYLLHKLRIVTYGPDYTISFICPNCKKSESVKFNLDELKINQYTEDVKDLMTIKLPSSGRIASLRFQTPRDMDNIENESKEMLKKFPDMKGNPNVLLTLESFIESIDGKLFNKALVGEELKQLSAADYNAIVQAGTKLNEKVGIDTVVTVTCPECNNDIRTVFRYTGEFFRPNIY